MIGAASLLAVSGMLACEPALADTVPPFRGNDTGGIIAYPLASQAVSWRSITVPTTARW
jgi:hypothetical protein